MAAAAGYSEQPASSAPEVSPNLNVFGFHDFRRQAHWDEEFLAVPNAELAREHLRRLTSAPHWASSPEDYATAQYVAEKFRAAGLQTGIVPYLVWMNRPITISVQAWDAQGNQLLSGPTPAHLSPAGNSAKDHVQEDPRVLPGFNGSSPSGEVTGEVVYANYGLLSDFQRLAAMGLSLKGKIVLVRYGGDFRGVKVYLAQHYGASGVLIYSDPADDGYISGATYPDGPFRPNSAVQRGSVQFMPVYPGDPTTPGVASVPNLPDGLRLTGRNLDPDLPRIPVIPLSSNDAAPIVRALGGPAAPHDWEGGLGFPYRTGGTPEVSVHMRLVQETKLRTIWDVVGTIPGTASPRELVIAGNHRDAWVYGAADPGSGTAAMLEAVHGLGDLLKHGWRPRRTIVIGSWDAEEEGLIGSTEWAEQHAADLTRAVAYFNTDVAVSGPDFNAGAVPSLRQFLREVAREVPSPAGGSVYDRWRKDGEEGLSRPTVPLEQNAVAGGIRPEPEPRVGELGSGSDYTPFLQHFGVPSTDIASDGPFGVYHTVYDNFDWFSRFADPTFAYTQQQARILGLEVLHMADADVLPYDDHAYGAEIRGYLDQARSHALARDLKLDFAPALAAARQFEEAGGALLKLQRAQGTAFPQRVASLQATYPGSSKLFPHSADIDRALSSAERALLLPRGLPRRPWYRHSVYAPGEFTGYAAVVIPGVNEAIDAADSKRAQEQLDLLTSALSRAAHVLTLRPDARIPIQHPRSESK